MPSFNFFKRKGKEVSKLNSRQNDIQVNKPIPLSQNLENRLTIEDTQSLLNRTEEGLIRNLLTDLGKTFQDTNLIFHRVFPQVFVVSKLEIILFTYY